MAVYGSIKFTTGEFGLSDLFLGTNYYRHITLLNVQYLLASVISLLFIVCRSTDVEVNKCETQKETLGKARVGSMSFLY